ncbi:MAG TPA: SPOR domain-containing protein [Candidatus Acidoferrales bacterium]|nr:SPOR domain-containing protein [Candidatus Acidoferrales bacterium]
MGMNFQDQPTGDKPQQRSQQPNFDDPNVDDIFIDSPSGGLKLLWIALVVVIIAGVGGGLYLLNKYGYLKMNFLHKKHTISVVAESTPPPTVPSSTSSTTSTSEVAAPTTSATPGTFAIQVSAFKAKPLADKYATKLKNQGLDAFVFAGEVPNEGTWFKVCVGSYDTKIRAIAATEDMKRKVGTDVWVVPVQ